MPLTGRFWQIETYVPAKSDIKVDVRYGGAATGRTVTMKRFGEFKPYSDYHGITAEWWEPVKPVPAHYKRWHKERYREFHHPDNPTFMKEIAKKLLMPVNADQRVVIEDEIIFW